MSKFKTFLQNINLATKEIFTKAPKAYALVILVQITFSILPYIGAYYFGQIGSKVIDTTNSFELIMLIAAVWVGISLAESICGTIAANFRIWSELHVYRSLESDYLYKTNDIDIGQTESPEYVATFQKVKNSAYPPWKLQTFFDRYILFISTDLVRLVASMIIIFQTDILYSIILIVFLLPKFISELVYGSEQFDIWSNPDDARDRTELYAIQVQLDHRDNKAEMILHNYINPLISMFKGVYTRIVKRKHRSLKKKVLLEILSDVLYQIGILLLLFTLIKQTLTGVHTFAFFTLVFYSLGQIAFAVTSTLGSVAFLITNNPTITEIRKIYGMKSLLTTSPLPNRTTLRNSIKREYITFDHVSFKYIGSKEFQNNDLHFTLNKGDRLAIVGLNGAGKSTCIKLLSRIYDPSEGSVLVEKDGLMHPLNTIHTADWQKNISCLFQDYARYNFFTAKDYITFNEPYDEKRLHEVIHLTTAEFVYDLPNGIEQQLGIDLGGINLSKGQWQKLALARTLYRQADLIILDEPTAAIDAISARHIFENLRNIPSDKTLILISHNMIDIPFVANRIMLLEHGKIVGLGTHKQLLARSKAYQELYTSAKEENTIHPA